MLLLQIRILEVINVQAETLDSGSHLPPTTSLEVPEVVESGQGLVEIDIFKPRSETTSQEGGNETRRKGARLRRQPGDLVGQLRLEVGRRIEGKIMRRLGGFGRLGGARSGSTLLPHGIAVQAVHCAKGDLIGAGVAKAMVEDPIKGGPIRGVE